MGALLKERRSNGTPIKAALKIPPEKGGELYIVWGKHLEITNSTREDDLAFKDLCH